MFHRSLIWWKVLAGLQFWKGNCLLLRNISPSCYILKFAGNILRSLLIIVGVNDWEINCCVFFSSLQVVFGRVPQLKAHSVRLCRERNCCIVLTLENWGDLTFVRRHRNASQLNLPGVRVGGGGVGVGVGDGVRWVEVLVKRTLWFLCSNEESSALRYIYQSTLFLYSLWYRINFVIFDGQS